MAVVKRQLSETDFERFVSGLPYPPNRFQLEILRSLAFDAENILVNALAGSGKTSLLMQSAALLKEMGARPEKVLFLAFNKKIRDEMNERLPAGFEAVNSHRLGNQVLAANLGKKTSVFFKKWREITEPIVTRMGYVKNSYPARMLLENLCSKAMMSNLKLVDLSESERLALPAKLRAVVAHFSLGGRSEDEAEEKANRHMIEDMISAVPEAMLKAKEYMYSTGKVSFDEMLYWPVALNMTFPTYDYVMIDECQDLNKVQQEIAMRSTARNGIQIWCGDEKQAIYGFAGADANSFGNIQSITGAKVLPLNINYRCGKKHLDLARAIVPQIEAHDKAIDGIVSYIDPDDEKKKPLDALNKGALVVCRLTAPLVSTYFELLKDFASRPREDRIPVKVLGKDIANELGSILKKVSKIPGFSYIEIVKYLTDYEKQQRNFLIQKDAPESQIQKLEDSVEVLTLCVENFSHCASLTCLQDELKGLFGDEKDKGYKQDDFITLLSVHRAKGLEADQVAILKPDKMPLKWKGQHPWEFEQEMNILYVALTRAKKELVVFGAEGSLNVDARPDDRTNSRALDSGIRKEEVTEDVMDVLPDPEQKSMKKPSKLKLRHWQRRL